LVNTFLTTPLVNWLYIRHKDEFEKEEEDHYKDAYSVLLCINDLKFATRMVTVSSLFKSDHEIMHVRSLIYKEIDDRPSTFFFSEFYSAVYTPFAKGKLLKKNNLAYMKQSAESMGMKFEAKTLVSSDPIADVTSYIEQREFNLVLFEAYQSFEDSRSLIVEKVFDWDIPSLSVARHSILNTTNASGIIIDKSRVVKDTIEKILVIYTGKEFEHFVLKTALQIRSHVQISILSSVPIDGIGVNLLHINLVVTENLIHDVLEESKKGYDLILIGADRQILLPPVNVLRDSPTPVLVLYPRNVSLASSREMDLPV